PHYFVADRLLSEVSLVDPPGLSSGMVNVLLDTQGRLREFEAVPPERDDAKGSSPDPDWSTLFTQAGLDPARFTSVEPQWAPRTYADRRAAWEGSYSEAPDLPLRIEAASYRGKPVSFRMVLPWT